jgi:hypothetical protein
MTTVGDKIAQFRAQWDRLSPRERRMLTTMFGVIALFVVGLFGYFVWSGLGDIDDHNDAVRQALKDIEQHRDEFIEARRRMTSQEVRVSRTPMQLSTVLEAAAGESGIKIDESNDRTPAPRGKRFIEKGIDLKIRRADLQSLTKFLKKIETGPNLVVVDRLLIRSRYNEHEQLDVEVGVMTFEHAPQAAPGKTNGPTTTPLKTDKT